MDALVQHLIDKDWLHLRDVLRLCLLSGLFTVAAVLAFPRNAPSRRALVLAAVISLTLLPWLLSMLGGVWTVNVETLPHITLATLLPNFLLWLWLVVAVLGLARYCHRVMRELKLVAECPRIEDPALTHVVVRLCEALNMPAPVLREADAACATSLRQPSLLLPANFREWDPATLEAVLAHELVHIKRRDDRWMMTMRALVLLYWWMPWIKLLAHKHLQVMEESCDDAASELSGPAGTYAHALVTAAGLRANASPVSLTSMHAHHLVSRISRFTNARFVELDTPGVYWCVMGILVTVVLLTSVEPVVQKRIVPLPDIYVRAIPIDAVTSAQTNAYYAVVSDDVRVVPAAHASPDTNMLARLHNPQYQPPAIYPGHAIRRGLEGDVTVEYHVNKDGSVSQARILDSEPADLFDQSALRAVRNMRYAPSYTTDVRVHVTRASNRRPPTRVQKHFRYRMVKD